MSTTNSVIQVNLPPINLQSAELEALLERAAKRGAEQAIDSITSFNYKEACERLGISYSTLQKRLQEGKLNAVDGRITAIDIRNYLAQKRRD